MKKLIHEQVMLDIYNERVRHDELVAAGKIKIDCACYFAGPATQMPVLIEEVGEWARATHEEASLQEQYTEIVQVAAVAVAIAESLRQKLSPEVLKVLDGSIIE